MSTSVFLSYNFNDQEFVRTVARYLRRQPGLDGHVYFYEWYRDSDAWQQRVTSGLEGAAHFVLFHGERPGRTQWEETVRWCARRGSEPGCKKIIVKLPNCGEWPFGSMEEQKDRVFHSFLREVDPLVVRLVSGQPNAGETEAARCAAALSRALLDKWIPYDGLPDHYIFHYEKDVIAQFASPSGRPEEKYLEAGCPEKWPEVRQDAWPAVVPPLHRLPTKNPNPLPREEIGNYRPPQHAVLVDVRSEYHRPVATADGLACCLAGKGLTFPEAGPREFLHYGKQNPLNVGILVAGGIAPGINAVIAGIVDRHRLYWKGHLRKYPNLHPTLVIRGYRDGFSGLVGSRSHSIRFAVAADDDPQHNRELAYVMENANSGGSMYGTSRYAPLADLKHAGERNNEINAVLSRLWADKIDILYIIGGDGSLKAAHALDVLNGQHLEEKTPGALPFSVVGIPKTMDNDILWVWQSFGFLSAVEKASDCLKQLHTEASSNPRLCVIQLFGSDSGFTVSHAALASLLCDAALIPEMRFDMDGLFAHIRRRLAPRFQPATKSESPFGIVVMAETAVPEDWFRYVRWQDYLRFTGLDREGLLSGLKEVAESAGDASPLVNEVQALLDEGDEKPFTLDLDKEEIDAILEFLRTKRRVYGQTPDALRTASLKLVSRVLEYKIQHEMGDPYWSTFRVFTNEPRHLLRAIAPSSNDIITGRRFGTLAVDNAIAGYTDFMISQWLTEYVLVPLALVILGRKRVPDAGIFWKSVLAKTEQPEKLLASPAVRATV